MYKALSKLNGSDNRQINIILYASFYNLLSVSFSCFLYYFKI